MCVYIAAIYLYTLMLCETKICARDVVDFICYAEYQDGGVGGKVLSNKMKKANGKRNFMFIIC